MPNTAQLTLEQINAVLDQLNEHEGSRLQYIGSRYVPLLGRKGEDSIEWDNAGTYEPLTIVLYQGNSYTSRQFVPVGIDITNQDYWASTGNYNAQIEQYRQEVQTFDERITGNTNKIAANTSAIATNTSAIETNASAIAANARAIEANTSAIATNTDDVSSLENKMNAIESRIGADDYNGMTAIWVGDSYVQASSLGDSQSKRFSTLVSEYFNLTEKNYAAGATGYTHGNDDGNNSFIQQVQAAADDPSIDKSKVRFLFVAGGRNDALNNNSAWSISGSTVGGWFTQIKSIVTANWPNCRVIYVPMLYDCTCPSLSQIELYGLMIYNFNFIDGCDYIPNAFMWLNGRYNMILASDHIHPTVKGHRLIANNIIRWMRGFNVPGASPVKIVLTGDNVHTGGRHEINVDADGYIWLTLAVKTSSAINKGQTLLEYTQNPQYENTNTLLACRGKAYIMSTNQTPIPLQVVMANNFADKENNASSTLVIQPLANVVAETNIDVTAIVGRVGYDFSDSTI